MSSKDSKFVVESTNVFMDPDGKLFHYFSDALEDPDQVKLREWAQETINPTDMHSESNVTIVLDLPKAVEGILDDCYALAMPDGSFLAELDIKPAFEGLKRQLEEALALLNRLQYVGATSTTEL